MPDITLATAATAGRRRPRFRVAAAVVAAVVFALVVSARAIAGLYTDWLWFGSLRLRPVWTEVLGTKVGLAVVMGVLFGVLVIPNLMLARRGTHRAGPSDNPVVIVREVVDRRPVLVHVGVALVVALPFAAAGIGAWNEWILFRNYVAFDLEDPLFNHDVGFYVFQLPFLAFLADWLFGALMVVTIASAAAHYLWGGIRLEIGAELPNVRLAGRAKAHLSLLLAAVALAKAGNYVLDR